MRSHLRLETSPGYKVQQAAAIQSLEWSCLSMQHLMEMDHDLTRE